MAIRAARRYRFGIGRAGTPAVAMAAAASVPIHPTLSKPSTTNQSRFAGRLLRQGPGARDLPAPVDARAVAIRRPRLVSAGETAPPVGRVMPASTVAGLLQASICLARNCAGNVNLLASLLYL